MKITSGILEGLLLHVIKAQAMGMCFGVRDALQIIQDLPAPATTAIYGELVHNEQVNTALYDRGFTTVAEDERDALPDAEHIVITAHGISNAERQRLRAAGKVLIDTTCPLVRRAHEAAQELARTGWFVIVIGKPGHVEVRGITGDLQRFAVVQSCDDVATYNASRIAVICQTTTRPQDAELITAAIRSANPAAAIRFVNTICRPTRERQQAAERLVEQVEAMVVVGGRHSNNTRQLVLLAQQHGLPVVHIQSAANLDPQWFRGFTTVGLTAGTSTPQQTIDEVYCALKALPAASGAAILS